MIAKNFMKYPEALRFQHELFSNGYHNSPRIMRLMECIFDQRPSTPAWWTAAKAKARALAKSVRLAISDFFKEIDVKQLSLELEEPTTTTKELIFHFSLSPAGMPWLPMAERWMPRLRACPDDQDMMGTREGGACMGGYYKRYCRAGQSFQAHAKKVGHSLAYWGGFSQ